MIDLNRDINLKLVQYFLSYEDIRAVFIILFFLFLYLFYILNYFCFYFIFFIFIILFYIFIFIILFIELFCVCKIYLKWSKYFLFKMFMPLKCIMSYILLLLFYFFLYYYCCYYYCYYYYYNISIFCTYDWNQFFMVKYGT
jgi:hypothetical protein